MNGCSVALLFFVLFTGSNAFAQVELGLSSTRYLGQGSEARVNRFSTVDFGLNADHFGNEVDARVIAQSQIGLNDSEYRFIEMPEVYLATSKKWTGDLRITVGRKLVQWSVLDDTWAAGAFQSRFRWDYLHPSVVGGAGMFVELGQGLVKFTAYYSPVFVPDRGAPLDFSNGRVRSLSPWVVNPPYEIEILRKQVPVRYDAKIPSIGEIIRQNSVGAKLALGQDFGPFISTSYAYQPLNQLLMSYEGQLNLNAAGEVRATLYPRVAYHHVGAIDAGFRNSVFSGTLSLLADLPVDNTQPLVRTSQQVGNFYLLSPTLSLNPFMNRAAGGNMTVSYLKVFGKDLPDQGLLSDGVSSEFDSRYPYKSAFLFSVLFPSWRKLTVDLKFLLDLENPGTIVSWRFVYAASRAWKFSLATDILSSFTGGESDGTDFIHRYRENDRVTAGVRYVF
ncbi:MAG: hypothetical protein H7301_02155 [Cryobacterium sp.]|nr:hypothetical protein [Oligoflexia bacterium]